MATDYISREAAIACFHDWIDRYGHEHTADEIVEYQRIEKLPVADVVEVVRCRDCIYFIAHTKDCGLYAWGGSNGLEYPEPDDFCSRGERRPDDGN